MSNYFLVSLTVRAGICCFGREGDIHPSLSGGGGDGVPKGILGQHQAMGVVLGPGMHQPSLN